MRRPKVLVNAQTVQVESRPKPLELVIMIEVLIEEMYGSD